MLGVNQSDFMSYMSALKTNYRKGIHRMEAILANPTHAKEFAANLGGVSVVLGVPVGLPDRNSDKLLELLLGSDVADDAVETWLHQFYEFTGWDDLLSDSARCKEMANNPLIWRAAGGSKLAVGKSIATLAGLSCSAYKDIDAVVTSQVAMAAVAASQVAMTAVAASQVAMAAIVKSPVAMAAMWRSDTAIKALQANATAWKTFTGASSAVMGKTVAILANLDPSGYADMTAIAASQVAMTAVAASQVAMAAIIGNPTALNAVVTSQVAMAAVASSQVAMTAIQKSQTALSAIAASSMATAKYAAGAAGLNPADYADMTAIAASQVAMTAVAASQVAMTAVAASNTATKAIAASQTALNAIAGSTTALDALYAKKSRLTGASASKSGKFIILQISNDSAFDTSRYGYATLSDGSQPNWQDYKSKYAYFKQFKKIATYIKNDTEGDDWIDYFPCG